MLIRSDIRQYIRGEVGELESAAFDDAQVNQWINLSQNKVQQDIFPVNFKAFIRTAQFTGSTFAQPTNLLQVPNAIINLRASAGGVRAFKTISYTGPTAVLTHTYKEAGTGGNAVTISCDGGTFAGTLTAGNVSCVLAGGIFYIDFGTGSTITQIVNALNANPVYSQYFICSSVTSGSTVPSPSVGTTGLLATGAGGNYYPANEVSSETFVAIAGNRFKMAEITSPKYRRVGNVNGKLIEVAPNTINYCEMDYYYRAADLTADTSTLDIPAEAEELVLLEVLARAYEKTENANLLKKTITEYDEKMKKYIDTYLNKRKSETEEKVREVSAGVNN